MLRSMIFFQRRQVVHNPQNQIDPIVELDFFLFEMNPEVRIHLLFYHLSTVKSNTL